jgi:YggT family protein
MTRVDVADFLSALLNVYLLCVFAYIVVQLVFSLGRMPTYNRPLRAVLDFLHDVVEPYLRIFRPLPLRAGPFDFTPIVAIILLQVVGSLIIRIVRGY